MLSGLTLRSGHLLEDVLNKLIPECLTHSASVRELVMDDARLLLPHAILSSRVEGR